MCHFNNYIVVVMVSNRSKDVVFKSGDNDTNLTLCSSDLVFKEYLFSSLTTDLEINIKNRFVNKFLTE